MDFYNERNKTTCEIYHEIPILELLPSVQSSLFRYLHLGLNNHPLNQTKTQLINIAKSVYSNANLYIQSHKKNKLDILFRFYDINNNYLGIQNRLVKNIHAKGLKTGIISNKILSLNEFDEVLYLPLSFTISSVRRKKIINQCKYISSYLEKHNLGNINRINSYLIQVAIQIERQARFIKRLLEIKETKLVILTNPKDVGDTAMQIACTNVGIPSIIIPHGFPQRSQYPLSSSFVASFAPHHHDYLKHMSLPNTELYKLGWLEPSVTLPNHFYIDNKENNSNINIREKHHILFLSQISGVDIHRCKSLLYYLPDILKTLDKMAEVEIITLRLRSQEVNNTSIMKLFNDCECKKLRITKNSSIIDDLKSCSMIMSFSSTGLLYAPYLNKKAVEIRDEMINSVWSSSVLPKEQVYTIGQHFNSSEFSDFVLNTPILNGESVFHNWGSEYKDFDNFLDKLF